MPEPRSPKKTVRTFTITNLRNLFLFHMFVGMGIIFFFTYNTGYDFTLSIYSSLAIMVFYFFISRRYVAKIAPDTVGDSNYYLGFIFTLFALVLTLILGFKDLGDDELNFTTLIQEFGVAMITTLAGLVARILISQFSITSDEADEEVRNRIADTVSKLAVQLKIAEENLQTMINNSQNRLNMLVEGSTDIVKEFFNEQGVAFKKASDEYIDAIRDNSSELKKQTNQLNTTFEKITTNTDKFYNSLSNISESSERLDSSITNINKIVSDKDFQNKIQNFNQSLDKLNERFDNMNVIIGSSKKSVEDDLQYIEQQKNELKKASQEATESLKVIQTNLTSLSKFIIDKLS